jgi:hypothetical protein
MTAATGEAMATAEQMLLHVDAKAGKAVPAPAAVLDKTKAIAKAHAPMRTQCWGRSVDFPSPLCRRVLGPPKRSPPQPSPQVGGSASEHMPRPRR